MKLRVSRIGTVEVPLPRYQTDGAAGMDLHAALAAPVTIAPGQRAKIPTGLAMAIPVGFEGQVRPRSGLAARFGLTVLNAPGTIDSDYRGEVAVVLINHGAEPATIEPGMRVAQIVFASHARADVELADALDDTARGDGGYGSTGA